LRAAVPGPAVLLVIPLQVSPEAFAGAASAFAVAVSRGAAERLSQFLRGYLAKDAKGRRGASASGPIPEASSTPRPEFSMSHTPATPRRQRPCFERETNGIGC
jgi:hypothetical protein